MRPVTLSLKGKALALLAARDYSRAEMERKLLHWLELRARAHADALTEAELQPPEAGLEPAERLAAIHAVLDEMQHKQFQSDERAAQSLVYRRAGKLGTARIAQELRCKGLDDSTIEQALDTLEGTELERAREVWQRKFSQPPATPQERAKQMRFLASRGFGGDVVRQVLRGSED